MQATVSHFEIPARRIERAARFYRIVFGWQNEPRPWPGGAYRVLRGPAGAGGQPGIDGGLLQMRDDLEEAPPGIPRAVHDLRQPLLVIHISGAPLQQILDLVVAEGGAVDLPPVEVGPSGLFARFRDSEGNLLGLWQEHGWVLPAAL